MEVMQPLLDDEGQKDFAKSNDFICKSANRMLSQRGRRNREKMKWRVDWLDTAVQWTEEHLEEWRRDVGGERVEIWDT